MSYENKYLVWVSYVICGMSHGTLLAMTYHHIQQITPAQILLAGIVLSFVYGIIHKLWIVLPHPFAPFPSILKIMINLQRAGALTMFTALLLLYGEVFLDADIEPAAVVVYITALITIQTMLSLANIGAIEER